MSLYPDNEKRLERAKDLATQCVEFQTAFNDAKLELESAAQEASQSLYKAIKKVEPDTPEYKDWVQQVSLASEANYGNFTAPEWGTGVGASLVGLVVGPKVTPYLKNMLNTANRSQAAVQEAGAQVAEEAAENVAKEAAPAILEAAELESSEFSLSLLSKALLPKLLGSGGAAIVLAVVAELVTEAIDGATKRDQLRKMIGQAYKSRLQYKLLSMQYEALKEVFEAASAAFDEETENQTYTKAKLDQIASNLVNENSDRLDGIDENAARAKLADLDRRAGAWTNEDTLVS